MTLAAARIAANSLPGAASELRISRNGHDWQSLRTERIQFLQGASAAALQNR
jgi:hypothetical protein